MRADLAVAIVVAAAVGSTALPCKAQGVDARTEAATLFKQASSEFALAHYPEAAAAFEASHKLVPRAAALYSAARAWDASGEVDRAADDYEQCVERTDLHGVEADDARRRLSELEPRLGLVTVRAPDDARIWLGHEQAVLGAARVHLTPGDYDVRVERAGDQPWTRHVRVAAGDNLVLAVDLVPVPPTAPAVTSEAPQRDHTAAWVAFGIAAAGAIASGVLYTEAIHARDQFDASGDRSAPLRDSATAWRTATYAGYGVTAAALASGVTLYWVW